MVVFLLSTSNSSTEMFFCSITLLLFSLFLGLNPVAVKLKLFLLLFGFFFGLNLKSLIPILADCILTLKDSFFFGCLRLLILLFFESRSIKLLFFRSSFLILIGFFFPTLLFFIPFIDLVLLLMLSLCVISIFIFIDILLFML